jgi:signal transduction histidine kinase
VDHERKENRTESELDALVERLVSSEWPVRVEAVESLRAVLAHGGSRQQAQTVRAALLPLLDDTSWKVRLSLVASLAAVPGLVGVRDALKKLVTDPNRYVRDAAARALRTKRGGAGQWRTTTDKEDPVFQAIRAEIKRINPSSLSESQLYEAADRIAGIAYRAVASDATHELNTVLSGIDGFADQLKRRLESLGRRDKKVASLLASLKERAALAKRMVEDLRCYSSPSSEIFEEALAGALLGDALKLAQERAAAMRALPEVRVLDTTEALVSIAKGRMLRALSNIICNALEATDEHGLVTARVEVSPGTVAFVIRDNGCGMSEEQLAVATRCFTTNKRDRGGTGMGLAIAQRVIEEEHRGRLELESAVDEGTTVTVMLPVRDGGEGGLVS